MGDIKIVSEHGQPIRITHHLPEHCVNPETLPGFVKVEKIVNPDESLTIGTSVLFQGGYISITHPTGNEDRKREIEYGDYAKTMKSRIDKFEKEDHDTERDS